MKFGLGKTPEKVSKAPEKKVRYHTFNCEWRELEQILNEKDPEGKGTVYAVWPTGEAVRVVMRFE